MEKFEELVINGDIILSSDGKKLFNCSDTKIDELVIPGSIKSVDYYAFEYCNIKRLVFLFGVESIGEGAFEGAHINEIVIPNSVTYIADYNFKKCSGIKKIILDKNEHLNFIEEEYCKQKGILDIKHEGTIDDLVTYGKILQEMNKSMNENEEER